ncbi:MAG: M67 family metallopeptidase [candidate division NC10 bacterium]|nr:M67 family metallopeptidase [candidate division NC10 bacterium]
MQGERFLLRLTKEIMEEMARHACEAFPEECCGVILAGERGDTLRRCTNIQNRLHAENPAAHHRDARTAYYIDPVEVQQILNEADRAGWSIKALYHSHPDHEAYFSAEDRAKAVAPWGDPLFGDAAYVVVSVFDRRVRRMKAFAWNPTAKDFTEIPIEAA